MLPYRLLDSRTPVVSIIGGSIHGLLLFALLLYLPLFFQVSSQAIQVCVLFGNCESSP